MELYGRYVRFLEPTLERHLYEIYIGGLTYFHNYKVNFKDVPNNATDLLTIPHAWFTNIMSMGHSMPGGREFTFHAN